MAHVFADHAARPDSHHNQSLTTARQSINSLSSSRRRSVNSIPNFNADTETYEGTQTFLAAYRIEEGSAAGPVTITFIPRYQTCSGTSCIPPRTRQVSATLNIAATAPVASHQIPSGYIEAKPDAKRPSAAESRNGPADERREQPRRVSCAGLRIRPGRDLHALRLSR